MALDKGSVSVDLETGAVTASGAAAAVYQVLEATVDYASLETDVQKARPRKQIADVSNAIAALIDYIKANAEVSVSLDGTAQNVTVGSGSADVSGTGTGGIS